MIGSRVTCTLTWSGTNCQYSRSSAMSNGTIIPNRTSRRRIVSVVTGERPPWILLEEDRDLLIAQPGVAEHRHERREQERVPDPAVRRKLRAQADVLREQDPAEVAGTNKVQ